MKVSIFKNIYASFVGQFSNDTREILVKYHQDFDIYIYRGKYLCELVKMKQGSSLKTWMDTIDTLNI